jgi:AraC-like DNA-binding protein
MNSNEWSHLWHHKHLNLTCLQAFHSVRAYPRHSHDYYVIAVVDSGLQSFTYERAKYVTPVDGLILFNPGDAHTGEPIGEAGFGYQAIYPTVEHMAMIAAECNRPIPTFPVPRADDPQMAAQLRALIDTLQADEDSLEGETRLLWTLAELVKRFADRKVRRSRTRLEHKAVQKVRAYIDEHYAEPISLAQLAEQVHFSRYYLLHTFRDATGMPPHLYLESVRVRHAQRLLTEGQPLAQVAQQVGFSSQSHFSQRFKQIIGVTPGAYARQVGSR